MDNKQNLIEEEKLFDISAITDIFLKKEKNNYFFNFSFIFNIHY